MKQKLLIVLLVVAITGSGFLILSSSGYQDSVLTVKTTINDTSSADVSGQKDTGPADPANLEAAKTRSNLLIDRDKSNSGISILTLLRGLLGMLVLIAIAFVFSSNRKAISWKVVIIGLVLQVLLALGVLYVPFIQLFFEFAGKVFVLILDFTQAGVNFLFQSMVTGQLEVGLINFVVKILPTIIFFSALTSLLFYAGIIQKIVYGMAWVMSRLMKLSGAESLSVAGNIFLGQTESPLMIKEYLPKMNKSEMLLVMMGGNGYTCRWCTCRVY
jgi:hypothetical protein